MTARLGCSGRYFTRTVLPTAGRDACHSPKRRSTWHVCTEQRASLGWNSKYSRVNAPNNGGRQMRMARDIRVGQVFINNYGAGGGVELPFGGVKSSGYGREKGFEALYGFTTLKTVAVKHG